MNGETVISWNVQNFITVVLMSAVSIGLFILVMKLVRGKLHGKTNAQ